MAKNFNWQAEEEVDWEDAERAAEAPTVSASHATWRPWLLGLLMVTIVLAATAAAIYQQLSRRVSQATADVETEVRASHAFIQQVAAEGDVELFSNHLSGRDAAWALAQERLVRDGFFFGRQGLGLWPLAPSRVAPGAIISVTVSPDLMTAELAAIHTYAIDIGTGLTETVQLRQTAIYRLGPDRWLLTPPDAAFWGETVTSRGRYLTLSYPARDAAVGRRLALDLETRLAEMCLTLDSLACPTNLHIAVSLTPNPASLNLPDPKITKLVSSPGWRLELPTPTLAGLPIDEAGYRALARGYATHVLSAIITDLVGYECCARSLFYQALLDHQLQQLGLQPWPLTADIYRSLLIYPPLLNEMQTAWSVYALIDYLLTLSPLPVSEIQRTLTDEHTFPAWWLQVTGAHLDEAAFRQFIYARSRNAQTTPPTGWPSQPIRAICQAEASGEKQVYGYDWANDHPWTPLYSVGSTNSLIRPLLAAPSSVGDSAILLQELSPGGDPLLTSLWHDDQRLAQIERVSLPIALEQPGGNDPLGRYLVLFVNLAQAPSPFSLLDIAACVNGDCNLSILDGLPLWSPDGQHTLVRIDADFTSRLSEPWLLLADSQGRRERNLGLGRSPFWLDATRYGYVRSGSSLGREIIVAAVDGETDFTESRITTADLLPALPTGSLPNQVYIGQVRANPANPDMLFIATGVFPPDGMGARYLFSYDLSTGEVRLRAELQHDPVGFNFSPDGRWLVFTVSTNDVYLHDVVHNKTRPFLDAASTTYPAHWLLTWSADSRWLLTTQDGVVKITAPDDNYQYWLTGTSSETPFRSFSAITCSNAVWLPES